MKQLNKIQTLLYIAGGIMMVIGAASFAFAMGHKDIISAASWLFLVGTVLFALMQLMQTYTGKSIVIRRLKRIQATGDFVFILSGISMVDTVYHFFMPLFHNYENYITYVYNKWVVLLLIAVVLELYTVHRIDHELRKESNDR